MPRSPVLLALNATDNVIEIRAHQRIFRLKRPITLSKRKERGRLILAYEPLNIEVYGPDQESAVKAFAEAFEDAWQWVNEVSEERLDAHAVELKRRFESLLESSELAA